MTELKRITFTNGALVLLQLDTPGKYSVLFSSSEGRTWIARDASRSTAYRKFGIANRGYSYALAPARGTLFVAG